MAKKQKSGEDIYWVRTRKVHLVSNTATMEGKHSSNYGKKEWKETH